MKTESWRSERTESGLLDRGIFIASAAATSCVLAVPILPAKGFGNLRHSLASFLIGQGTDPKTVQTLLRHADVATTLGIYAHSHNEARMTAQGDMLTAFFAPRTTVQ